MLSRNRGWSQDLNRHAGDANNKRHDKAMALAKGAGVYFAQISLNGPVKYGQLSSSIGVLEALDSPMPIGMAPCRGWGLDGLAVWTLRIGGQELLGRWVIIDRQFRPAR
jgi:hypothetical protein